MQSKMLETLKNNWITSVITAASCTSLALGFIYRKNVYNYLWRMKVDNITKRSNKNVIVISTPQQWAQNEANFMSSIGDIKALGFDCEWLYHHKQGRKPVALLQLATYSGSCILVRISHLKDDFPSSLKKLLADETIIKAGVDPIMDAKYLANDHNILVRGCVDVRHLGVEIAGNMDTPLGLASMSELHLGKMVNKSKKVRLSNWQAFALSKNQIDYAADDALFGIQLLLCLVGKIEKIDSYLPLTNHELHLSKAVERICSKFKDIKFKQSNKEASFRGNSEKKTGILQSSNQLKETRRAYSLRKTPLYHNSQLWAPDNEPLCTCDPQKARWYVEKGLGELISDDPLVVRLKFEPAGRPNKEGSDGQFYLQERENMCVVCGKMDSYIRKNVIPHEYRKHFPEILKSHQSHDVLLLCLRCHQHSNILDNSLRYELASKYDAPIGSNCDIKMHVDGKLKTVRNAAGALIKSRHKMPQDRIEYLENLLREYFNCDTLNESLLTKYANMDVQIYNEDYVPHGYKVYLAFEKKGLIHLEMIWRQWFLDKMEPKYLPDKWSTGHNHEKLKIKMSRLPMEHPLREDYKMALVGTEGSIDIPYILNINRLKNTDNFFGLN